MTVKEAVLEALEKNRDVYVSGEALADSLGVSRAAVGKAVKGLREEGYEIEAITKKGYLMPSGGSELTEEAVKRMLPKKLREKPILMYDVLDSTNLQAKRLLSDGLDIHGATVIAAQQTAGRGRLGRSFYSPKDGLYMSIIINPSFDISKAGLVTVAAAAATSEAIDTVCGCQSQIKWVNDIYLDGKKVCGILTEANTDFESGQIDSLIIGIGINTSSAKFPVEMKQYAGSIGIRSEAKVKSTKEFSAAKSTDEFIADTLTGQQKAMLTATVIKNVLKYTDELSTNHTAPGTINHTAPPTFLNSYRSRCMLLGRDIYVYKGKYRKDPTMEVAGIPARAVDIDDAGGLIVRYNNGLRETLINGEVSIRL